MRHFTSWLAVVTLPWLGTPAGLRGADAPQLQAGFAEVDVTPKLGGRPVYMAGFSQNRKATAIHDPLLARAIVVADGTNKLALVSVDVVGFFNANAVRVRKQLPGFTQVVISSTHNHEGPDTLGLWGPNPFSSGIDREYLNSIEDRIITAVREADRRLIPVRARLGKAPGSELLHDAREPYIKHDELVAIQFLTAEGEKPAGLLVQWNCHPETLGSKNTQISADFVGYTVRYLRDKYRCPVVYFTGTVGGLMTSLNVPIKDDAGKALAEESYEKTDRYGLLVGQLADRALKTAQPVSLAPIAARSLEVFLPMDNKLYVMGRQLGVLEREAFLWAGHPYRAEPAQANEAEKRLCLRTEVGWLRLGDLEIAVIPGEIYPELVLSKVQDPPDKGADFPEAPMEPGIYRQMRGPHRMLLGLANDEIGYIIPKRQWDEKPPFCYGRSRPQYGETNSVGPEAAPILCRAFHELVIAPTLAARAVAGMASPGPAGGLLAATTLVAEGVE